MESNTKSYFGYAIAGFLIWTSIYFNTTKLYPSYLTKEGANNIEQVKSNKTFGTIVYFAVLIILQICIGWTVVGSNTKCDILKNNGKMFGNVFISTFCPWFFIFGLAVIINLYKTQFKQVFSNTFGYMFAGTAGDAIITTLLEDKTDVTTQTINKIYDNPSFLINTFTPENFIYKIEILKGLFKPDYKKININTDTTSLPRDNFAYNSINFTEPTNEFNKLFKIVEKKDIYGEFFWYLYNALFVIAVVTYNISLISCN